MGRGAIVGVMTKPFSCSLVSKAGDRGRQGHGSAMAMVGACGNGHAPCVTLSGSRCLHGTHPMGFQGRLLEHERRIGIEEALDFSSPPTVPVLCFLKAEEGTKEGDDEGVSPVSQRGER